MLNLFKLIKSIVIKMNYKRLNLEKKRKKYNVINNNVINNNVINNNVISNMTKKLVNYVDVIYR